MDNNATAIKKLKFHLQGRNNKIVPALVGLTGVGKTAITNRVAKELGWECVYFNMAQQNEGDNAIPVPQNLDAEATLKYILHHKFQEILKHPEKKYLVFADEFTRANIPVISEWMTIINERQYQGYKFGDNVRFVAAMNPSTSMKGFEDTEYAAIEMDDAHAARFTFIYLKADREDWLEWAQTIGDIHPAIISFISDPKHLNYFYGRATQDIRMRTPRTWEFLSDQLKDVEEQGLQNDRVFITSLISDQIGEDVSGLFAQYMWDYYETIDYDEVISNKKITKKTIQKFDSFSLQKQTVNLQGILDVLKEKFDNNDLDLSDVAIDNFLTLWERVKSEDSKFKFCLFIDNNLIEIDQNAQISTGCPAYRFWEREVYETFNEKMEKLNQN